MPNTHVSNPVPSFVHFIVPGAHEAESHWLPVLAGSGLFIDDGTVVPVSACDDDESMLFDIIDVVLLTANKVEESMDLGKVDVELLAAEDSSDAEVDNESTALDMLDRALLANEESREAEVDDALSVPNGSKGFAVARTREDEDIMELSSSSFPSEVAEDDISSWNPINSVAHE